jgi:thymidylate synthase (FAD)
MILVKPSFEILAAPGIQLDQLKKNLFILEYAGRICYKSHPKGDPESFIRKIITSVPPHESVIEHFSISVHIVCDRGVSHEIVRHRLVSYSQESTRYCNYKGGVTFVIPPWVNIEPGNEYFSIRQLEDGLSFAERNWFTTMVTCESEYIQLLNLGWTPQQARSVLPNSLKTELVMTCNLREWRHFFKLRTTKAAHPKMREIAIPMLEKFKELIPVVFEDIHAE